MRGRVRGIAGHLTERLTAGWTVARCAPDLVKAPQDLGAAALDWIEVREVSTAAAALREAGRWDAVGEGAALDSMDWWFRTRFSAGTAAPGEQRWLVFDGIATLAQVWLNGKLLLESDGMFTAHERRVDEGLAAENELVIRCRSIDAALAGRRPRPRWRVPMVEQQQLRWIRTTLLGRTPGWSPPAATVGPWRDVRLERRRGVDVVVESLRASADGRCTIRARLNALDGDAAASAELAVTRAGKEHRTSLSLGTDGAISGELRVANATRWWPHTHGIPALYDATLLIRRRAGEVRVSLGSIGFRDVAVETADGDFIIRVNGERIFCRGACWTPLDPIGFTEDQADLDRTFDQLVRGGMNMLRVGGTMVYESDAFLDRCDARGILLWQDLMFANFDYPEDATFTVAATTEARQQLSRLQGRPSLAVVCGNSEGEQQAAMWGAERARWAPALFHQHLAAVARECCPDVPYQPSSTHGGEFPHQSSAGTSSYYGVGAYLRPLEDARRADVRFATECLAFANVPGDSSLAQLPGGSAAKVHSAAWRTRSPRDRGAGWDFDDVRDHYLQSLFGVDAAALRYADHDRYLDLGRVATGEAMAASFTEWRRAGSRTGGALVWFLRDLWHGAGWGLLDADGAPKAAYSIARRALAPTAIGITDEGTNGLALQLVHDGAAAFEGAVSLTLIRQGDVVIGRTTQAVRLGERSAETRNALALFDSFHDLSYAYRFGPPPHDVVLAELKDLSGETISRAAHWTGGFPGARERDLGLAATPTREADGSVRLSLSARRLAAWVHVEAPGLLADDDYFHLAPGEQRAIILRPFGMAPPSAAARGVVRAINGEVPLGFAIP